MLNVGISWCDWVVVDVIMYDWDSLDSGGSESIQIVLIVFNNSIGNRTV